VAEFEFDTFEVPDQVTPFNIDLPLTEQVAENALRGLQAFAVDAPKELNMFLYINATGQSIQGLYFGGEDLLYSALQPLLKHLKTNITYARSMNWLQGLERYADGEALNQTYPYNSVNHPSH
jgi:hypothetical protein